MVINNRNMQNTVILLS